MSRLLMIGSEMDEGHTPPIGPHIEPHNFLTLSNGTKDDENTIRQSDDPDLEPLPLKGFSARFVLMTSL